jgi:hypothetical protein
MAFWQFRVIEIILLVMMHTYNFDILPFLKKGDSYGGQFVFN